MPTGAVVYHSHYWGNHLPSDWTGGLLHRRELLNGTVNLVNNPQLWGSQALGELAGVDLLNSHIAKLLSKGVWFSAIDSAAPSPGQRSFPWQRHTLAKVLSIRESQSSAIAGTSISTFSSHSSGTARKEGAESARAGGWGGRL